MAVTVPETAAIAERAGADDCDHTDTEFLGAGGQAIYMRCACGVVLVAQGDRMWVLRPVSN